MKRTSRPRHAAVLSVLLLLGALAPRAGAWEADLSSTYVPAPMWIEAGIDPGAVAARSDRLPFGVDTMDRKGFTLPFPFGVAARLGFVDQTMSLREMSFDFDVSSVNPEDVSITGSSTTDMTIMGRVDAWVFPFVNLYGMLGFLQGNSNIKAFVPAGTYDITVDNPFDFVGPTTIPVSIPDFDLDAKGSYSGPLWGLGMELAAGRGRVYGSLDLNFQHTSLSSSGDLTGGSVEVFTVTPKVGMRLEPGTRGSGDLWVGASFMDSVKTFEGTLPTSQLAPQLAPIVGDTFGYELQAESDETLAIIFGGRWTPKDGVELLIEVGAGARTQITGGIAKRF